MKDRPYNHDQNHLQQNLSSSSLLVFVCTLVHIPITPDSRYIDIFKGMDYHFQNVLAILPKIMKDIVYGHFNESIYREKPKMGRYNQFYDDID